MNEPNVTQTPVSPTANTLEQDYNARKLSDLRAQVVTKIALLKMADIATMLMLFIFMVGFYVSDPFHLVTFMTEGFNKNPAEMFTYVVLLAFAGIMAYTIAHLKREHYHHTARHNKNVWKVGLILVIFSMTGEIYNSLGSQQHSQMSKAEGSEMFKAVANQQIILSSGSGDTGIADAAVKLAQCNERMAQGKEKHCKGATARLDALKSAKADNARAQADSVANASGQKTKDMLAIVDANTHPFYSGMAQIGIPVKLAALLLAAFVAYSFERMHLTLPEDLKDLYQQINALETDGLNLAKTGLNPARSTYEDDRPAITTRGKGFEVPPEKQPMGFGYPSKASAFKYANSAASGDSQHTETDKPFGFLPRNTSKKPDNKAMLSSGNETGKPVNVSQTQSIQTPDLKERSLAELNKVLSVQPDSGIVECPLCGKSFMKSCITHRFCCDKHREVFHNIRRREEKRHLTA